MFNKKIVNENGEIKCSICGQFLPASEFYENRNQCKRCYNKKAHQRDMENRVRSARQSQLERTGKLTKMDNLTAKDVFDILDAQGWKCPGCGYSFDNFDFHISHITSAKNGGPLHKHNIQCLCSKCNHEQYDKNIVYVSVTIDMGNTNIDTRW